MNRPTPISVFSDQRRTKSITWSRTSCGTQLPVRVPQDFFLARCARPSTRPGPRPWSAPSSPRTQSVSASPPPGGGEVPEPERQPLRSRRTPSASGRTPSAAAPLPHTSPRPEPCPKGGASEWPPSPLPCNAFVPFSYVRSAILTDERFLHFQLRQDKADKDVAQFLRAERRARQRNREDAGKLLSASLDAGTLIFRGQPKPVSEAGATLDAAARNVLETAAQAIFPNLRLVPIRPSTDLAGKFLAVERLDRMPRELDPLGLVVTRGGRPRIDVNNQALAETLRAFGEELNKSGGRLQGNFIQDFFYAPPYGWSKDATRYLFAALLLAGEIELFTAGGKITT